MYLNARYNYVLWDKILHINPSSHAVIESLCNVSLNKDYIIVMLPGSNHASLPIPFSFFIDLWNKSLYRIFNRTNVPPTHTHIHTHQFSYPLEYAVTEWPGALWLRLPAVRRFCQILQPWASLGGGGGILIPNWWAEQVHKLNTLYSDMVVRNRTL